MCKSAVRKEFDVVLAWSVDRLGRSLQRPVTPAGIDTSHREREPAHVPDGDRLKPPQNNSYDGVTDAGNVRAGADDDPDD